MTIMIVNKSKRCANRYINIKIVAFLFCLTQLELLFRNKFDLAKRFIEGKHCPSWFSFVSHSLQNSLLLQIN